MSESDTRARTEPGSTPTLSAKGPSLSKTIQTHLVFPEHANALGKAFGGQVMAWIDLVGGICAMRHTGGLAVTASVDDLQFEQSLAIGDVAVVEARVNAAFRTSLEVEVSVWGESLQTRSRWLCVNARMTFVAIDEHAKPRSVPPLVPESDDDVARMKAAQERRNERLAKRKR